MNAVDLQDYDADALLRLFKAPPGNGAQTFSAYDWNFLAQIAATQSGLQRGQDDDLALKWSRVAVIAYDRCAAILAGSDEYQVQRNLQEESAARIRVWAIERFGPDDDDDVRDPRPLERWLVRQVPDHLRHEPGGISIDEQGRSETERAAIGQRLHLLVPLLPLGVFRPDSPVSIIESALRTEPVPAAENGRRPYSAVVGIPGGPEPAKDETRKK